MATIFDVQVRTIECKQCGAPLATAVAGGEVTCEYCGTVNLVSMRVPAAQAGPPRSMADDVARFSRLQGQLEHPVTNNAYELSRLPSHWAPGEIDTAMGLERARAEWREARGCPPPAAPEPQRELCWIAVKLADAFRRDRQPLKARAVLETVLELLQDEGHRHLIRCRLAEAAAAEGDLQSAAGWLGECDPAPEVLQLDSAYREAMARLRVKQGDAAGVITIVGSSEGDVPIDPEHKLPIALLRIQALELLGKQAEADAAIEGAFGAFGREQVLPALSAAGLAPRTALHVLEDERAKLPRGLLSAAVPSLWLLPILAAVLLIPVHLARCSCDADPLQGVYGYPLCPARCLQCRGPARVVTVWQHIGGGKTQTNGAQYFCPTEANGIERMSDAQLEQSAALLSRFELSWVAVLGATYLILLALLTLFLPFFVIRARHAAARKLDALEEQMTPLAAALSVPLPPLPEQSLKGFFRALLFFLASAGGAWILLLVGMGSGGPR